MTFPSIPGDDARAVAPTGEVFLSFAEIASGPIDVGIQARNERFVEALFKWYRQGQVACLFARFLARKPSEVGWFSLIKDEDFEVDQLTAEIDQLASSCEGLQIIFPGCDRPGAVARLLAKLCASNRWWCVEVPWEGLAGMAVGLRWNPSRESHTSWILGIAPFQPMPLTRRFVGAPFAVLVFRPGSPRESRETIDPTTGKPVAHLAHMAIDVPPAAAAAMQTGTEERRVAFLTPETIGAARGRVTFALPEECRPLLASALAIGRRFAEVAE